MLTRQLQIEQKIDTMYPRQDPTKMLAEKNAAATSQEEPSMPTSEAIILLLSVIGVLLLVGALMVRPSPLFRPVSGRPCAPPPTGR
jgi:hypothetical protein